ncbi:gag-aspartyl protease domain-containing protein [Tanacetum coccineum]|uniref:Gag-aspartyl protease domain-containing protein n=1 Tax=Tanacetum coccineum TaxID=301880 RepID=A0ABQ4WJ27_9ASTR
MKSKVEANGLRFVSTIVNEISTRALVDTGATRNFISVDEAKRVGLETMKDSGWIKAVNGDVKAISGVAQGVETKIEGWEGELDLSVVPMDDYKLVLGMEFFDKVKSIPITFTNTLCILDGGRLCKVAMERGTKSGAKMMFAMQLESGFKELKQDTSDMSSDIETSRDTKDVLEDFKGAISSVLPKRHAQESFRKGERRTRRRHRVTNHEQGSTMEEAKGESTIRMKACHGRDPIMLKRMHNEDVARFGEEDVTTHTLLEDLGISWEGLGSPKKLLKDLDASYLGRM